MKHKTKKAAKPKAGSSNKKFFQKKEDASFFNGEKETTNDNPFFTPQTKLEISQPDDPLEKEADTVADQVVKNIETGSGKGESLSSSNHVDTISPVLQKQEEEEEIQAKADGGGATVSKSVHSDINKTRGGGSPMSDNVKSQMEGGFGTNLGDVRIHTDNAAVRMSNQMGAKAFTYGNDIYFNKNQYNPNTNSGRLLLAHELTHTVQQGGGLKRKVITSGALHVARLPDFITDELAEYAGYIPGYKLFTVIIGYDPLRGRSVDRNAINLLEGLLGLLPPLGPILFNELQERGILQKAFDWVEGQLNNLDLSLNRIENVIEDIWDDVDILSGFDYNLNVAKRHFGNLLDDVTRFISSLTDQLLEMVKEVLVSALDPIVDDIPGYTLLKKILGRDPLRGTEVSSTTVEIIEEFLILIGKETELEQMRERGTIQETADWLDTQLGTFRSLYSQLVEIFNRVWDAISLESLRDPIGTITEVGTDFAAFALQVMDFAITVAKKVLELIKNALLGWMREFANDIPGYSLIAVMLGRDPIDQTPVERSVENIIRGFMGLVPGGEAKFQEMKQTGAIGKAAGAIENAIATLGITWEFITGLFIDLWNSFSIEDLLDPISAFQRILATFGEPISRLFRFVVVVVREIITIILVIMNFPFDIIQQIIANAMSAFEDIKNDPIGFLKNLLRAVKQGFSQFFENILTHLLNGVTGWLFGQIEDLGITPPPDLSFQSILNLVMQILGVTEERIWAKLAEKIGQEKVDQIRGMLERLTGIWLFIKDVMERGPIAIWEYIQEQLSNLWTIVLDKVKGWIITKIIEQVTVKLLSLLDPTGIMAVVNSFIAFYKAIESFIEYITEMLEIVNSFVAGVAEIARGSIQNAANFLENALADGLPIAIGFLANQVGLGRLGEKIGEMIAAVREMIDNALDWLMDKAISLGGAVLQMGRDAVSALREWWATRKDFATDDGESHSLYFQGSGASVRLMVQSEPEGFPQLIARRRTELNADPTGNAAKLTALTEAETIHGQMQNLIQTTTASQGASGETESIETQINSFLDQIKAKLIIAGVDGAQADIPLTNVTYQMSNGRASQISAAPLTHMPGNTRGSHRQSSVSILGWDSVAASDKDFWVKAHLLNADLHGPAANYNLVPGTKETNNNQKTEIETPAKNAVHAQDGRVFYYDVIVDYWPSESGKEHFQYFPRYIYMSWGEMEGIAGSYTKKSSTDISRTFFQDKPEATAVEMAAFNESSAGKIRDASRDAGLDLGPTVSGEIVKRRRELPHQSFGSNIENLISELDTHYQNTKNKPLPDHYKEKLRTLANTHIFMDFE